MEPQGQGLGGRRSLQLPVTASPCTKVCLLDPAMQWCRGCGRTIGEIAEWGTATPERREVILAILPDRLVQMRSDDISPNSD
ncbi:DUF1289 domain-containing protein [Sphingomonas colocasiae]|uniref:DUF1289 domain-containing protein n=1 Tax=Sphingomonas colocasiae TaxID=1848973 RepID=A0ABS7PJQ3_9SPHN|nr:DUF1289 domain-containing protein [Sphingomonas colocasiae]MBY8821491.1 DUF1289 domain-containing protein [Sphingomonas colocasiae]